VPVAVNAASPLKVKVTGLEDITGQGDKTYDEPPTPNVIVHFYIDVYPDGRVTSIGNYTLIDPPDGIFLAGVIVSVYDDGEKLVYVLETEDTTAVRFDTVGVNTFVNVDASIE
jgi:hypothetical protein